MPSRIDLTGVIINDLKVLSYSGNGYYKCQCSCGKIVDIEALKLRKGKIKDCGHSILAHQDITGQQFGEWLAIRKSDRGHWLCRCSCGTERSIKASDLIRGRTKSCGHNTTGKKDLTDKQFGDWKVLRPGVRSRHWVCQCSCGKIEEVHGYALTSGHSKSCGHDRAFVDLTGKRIKTFIVEGYLGNDWWRCKCECGNLINFRGKTLKSDKYAIKCNNTWHKTSKYIGKRFGDWTIIEAIHGIESKVKCRCICGTEKVLSLYDLTSGRSQSCGCTMYDTRRNTMLEKYGDVASNRINNPREKWKIDTIDDAEELKSFILKLGYKPTIFDLAMLLDVQPDAALKRYININ